MQAQSIASRSEIIPHNYVTAPPNQAMYREQQPLHKAEDSYIVNARLRNKIPEFSNTLFNKFESRIDLKIKSQTHGGMSKSEMLDSVQEAENFIYSSSKDIDTFLKGASEDTIKVIQAVKDKHEKLGNALERHLELKKEAAVRRKKALQRQKEAQEKARQNKPSDKGCCGDECKKGCGEVLLECLGHTVMGIGYCVCYGAAALLGGC